MDSKTALGTLSTLKPAKLTIHVTPDGFGWGLWQQIKGHKTLIGFGSQLWEGAEER